MGLVQLTPPAVEPLTVTEVETHLRLDNGAPEVAATAPVVALAGTAGNVDVGSHRYRVTFVLQDGTEREGGDISAAVTVADNTSNGQVLLTRLPIGSANVVARRIYRTPADDASLFLRVTNIGDNTATTYTDNTADAALTATCPTGDPYLVGLIQSARETAEQILRRALITQTWRLTLDGFPGFANGVIRLPMPPLQTVDAITYLDWSSASQTLAETVYSVDATSLPGRVIKNFAQVWPPTLPQQNVVQVDFTCGYGLTRASVPQAIRNGMLLLIGELYENRESVNVGNIVNDMPAIHRLWGPYYYREMA